MYQDGLRSDEFDFDDMQAEHGVPERFHAPMNDVSGNDHRDVDLGAIWGFGNERTHMVLGLNYFDRDRLQTLDRQFSAEYAVDDSLGGPSPFNTPQDMFANSGTVLVNDASCLALGNYRTVNSGPCSTKADLLARDMYSEETRWQGMGTWTHMINQQVET